MLVVESIEDLNQPKLPLKSVAEAMQTYLYVKFIWQRNMGVITVQRALDLLAIVEDMAPTGSRLATGARSLTIDIIMNAREPGNYDFLTPSH